MNRYIAIFEEFEEEFDNFHQTPDMGSDSAYQSIATDLIELANQYCESEIRIDSYEQKYGTSTRIEDLENDLIAMVNDQMGEDIAQEFAQEADQLLKANAILEKKKAKDAEFDIPMNAKKPGRSNKRMNSKSLFDDKPGKAKDNGFIASKKSKKSDNLENPGIKVNLRPPTKGANQ